MGFRFDICDNKFAGCSSRRDPRTHQQAIEQRCHVAQKYNSNGRPPDLVIAVRGALWPL